MKDGFFIFLCILFAISVTGKLYCILEAIYERKKDGLDFTEENKYLFVGFGGMVLLESGAIWLVSYLFYNS